MPSQLSKLVYRLLITRVASIIVVIRGIVTIIIICVNSNKYTTTVLQLENLLEVLHKTLPQCTKFRPFFEINYTRYFD